MRKLALIAVPMVLAACGAEERAGGPPPRPSAGEGPRIETATPAVGSGVGADVADLTIPDPARLEDLPPPSGVSGAAACPDAGLAPTPANLPRVAAVIVCLHNAERRSRGLRGLRTNPRLARAAAVHSRAMVTRKFFAHEAPGGGNVVTRARRAGYIPRIGRWTVGENLAFGSGPLGAPGRIMSAWMGSPAHKANVLTRRFREIGIGIVAGSPVGGGGGFTYTAVFGVVRR